jgi:hypothetical protein
MGVTILFSIYGANMAIRQPHIRAVFPTMLGKNKSGPTHSRSGKCPSIWRYCIQHVKLSEASVMLILLCHK